MDFYSNTRTAKHNGWLAEMENVKLGGGCKTNPGKRCSVIVTQLHNEDPAMGRPRAGADERWEGTAWPDVTAPHNFLIKV